MALSGWALKPTYDQQTHAVEWAFAFTTSHGNKVTNLNTHFLSRFGYYKVVLVGSAADFKGDTQDFNSMIGNLSFMPGDRYSDFRQGDRLAEYGLAGLIAGWAAVAAAKSGVFAGAGKILAIIFGKKVLVVLAVIGAAIMRAKNSVLKLFRRTRG